MAESPAQAGTTTTDFVIQSDAVLVTLYATAVSGTLDVSVLTVVDGEEALLFVFPQLTGATPNVLLRRSSISPENIRIRTTYSAACIYEVQARAVNSGSSDVKILGAESFRVSQISIGTSAQILIPSQLTDRSGLVVKNWSPTQTVYLAESSGSATTSIGYPLAPKDALALDITAGAEIWAVADAVGADVRLAEAGS